MFLRLSQPAAYSEQPNTPIVVQSAKIAWLQPTTMGRFRSTTLHGLTNEINVTRIWFSGEEDDFILVTASIDTILAMIPSGDQ